MSALPDIHDHDHPFNVWQKWAAPIAVVALLGLVVFVQYFLGDLRGTTLERALPEQVASEAATRPGVGPLVLESKLLVKSLRSADVQPVNTPGTREPLDPELREEVEDTLRQLDEAAITRTERLRVGIVVGEVRGAAAAIERLERLRGEALPEGDLEKDLYWLCEHYRHAASGTRAELGAGVRESLTARHGWFAELALAYSLADQDPARAAVLGGVRHLTALQLAIGALSGLAFIVGVVLTIVMIKRATNGEFGVEIIETGVPGRLYLETFGVFLTSFAVLLLVEVLVTGQADTWAVVAGEVMLWACAASIAWPLLRGVSWDSLRTDLGWTGGEGLSHEITAGVTGFLISMPLTLLVGIIAGALEAAAGTPEGTSAGVPMFRPPMSESWAPVVLGAVSAVVWAPVVEESLFRGALHRWMPAGLTVAGRVALSSIAFGIVHPYSPAGMAQVATGGVVFGLLREWRGSLVAPVAAHALHNGAITLVTILTLAALE